jgi:hypothetical protein
VLHLSERRARASAIATLAGAGAHQRLSWRLSCRLMVDITPVASPRLGVEVPEGSGCTENNNFRLGLRTRLASAWIARRFGHVFDWASWSP